LERGEVSRRCGLPRSIVSRKIAESSAAKSFAAAGRRSGVSDQALCNTASMRGGSSARHAVTLGSDAGFMRVSTSPAEPEKAGWPVSISNVSVASEKTSVRGVKVLTPASSSGDWYGGRRTAKRGRSAMPTPRSLTSPSGAERKIYSGMSAR
jgi:hypothetical protein